MNSHQNHPSAKLVCISRIETLFRKEGLGTLKRINTTLIIIHIISYVSSFNLALYPGEYLNNRAVMGFNVCTIGVSHSRVIILFCVLYAQEVLIRHM